MTGKIELTIAYDRDLPIHVNLNYDIENIPIEYFLNMILSGISSLTDLYKKECTSLMGKKDEVKK